MKMVLAALLPPNESFCAITRPSITLVPPVWLMFRPSIVRVAEPFFTNSSRPVPLTLSRM